jgi:hypothetical protein
MLAPRGLHITDTIKVGDAVWPARDSLPVDDAGARAQLGERLDDEREAVGPAEKHIL